MPTHLNVAIVGTGYVADLYMRTLSWHSQLRLIGVYDRDPSRSAIFSKYHNVFVFSSLDQVLNNPEVQLVLNLTNPREHFAVSKACLVAGKHVYSEKPLAWEMSEAHELVALAKQKKLEIASAPCSILGESAQTLWKALRSNAVGKVRLVYAEMDDGLVHKMPYQQWLSDSGFVWPYKDEFEVGCTLEHAGYYTTWLTALFGPAQSVTAFSSCLVPDKNTDVPLEPRDTPDFSVACIRFASGVVARLTCSIVAPHDHSLRVVGDNGVLSVKDCWFYGNPVTTRTTFRIRRKVMFSPFKKKFPFARKPPQFKGSGAAQMDFARGPAELASAVLEGRKNRIGADFSLHNNELVLAIQHAKETGAPYVLQTTFAPMAPMPWAQEERSEIDCLGVTVGKANLPTFLRWFDDAASQNEICKTLAIVNAHTLNLAHENSEFCKTLNSFSLVLNDGAGLELYGKMASNPFSYNFNGTDLLPTIFEHRTKVQKELRVFLLGARPGVALKAGENIEKKFPSVRVVGVRDGYSKLSDEALISEINASNAHLLLVALGNPLQEQWIEKNRRALRVGVACGIGALLDFLSGTVTRAPAWLRTCRMEWVYRLCLEPRRMVRRYVLGNPLFVMRAFFYIYFRGGKKS